MNLDENQIEEYFQALEENFDENSEFLRQHGWVETEEYLQEKNFSGRLWLNTKTGKKHPHTMGLIGFSISDAIDVAERQLLDDQGWVSIGVHGVHIEFEDKSESMIEDEMAGWQHFVHPTSGKLYMYVEAVAMARYGLSEDEEWCRKTRMLQESLGTRKLEPGDCLLVDIFYEGDDLTYRVNRIDKDENIRAALREINPGFNKFWDGWSEKKADDPA